ncbi:MAG: thiamine pyrophosphate-dependent dehydrogenase E1 component subunit alpha [Desulfobacterales bacterium]
MSTHSQNEIAPEILLKLIRTMLLIRKFEEKIIDVYPAQDMKTPVHLYIGQEAVAAGVCVNLAKDDYLFTNHRSHGHCLAKGADPGKLYAEFYGRTDGYCKGKGGSMHLAIPEIGIPGTSAIVGGGIPLGVGTALASKMKGDEKISAVFFGDGAVDEGVFHESLNFASLKKLPVIFVCENNFYSVNSHISARQPHDNIAKRAESYEVQGIQVNGNDVIAVYRASKAAVNRIRKNDGPTLIECRTYRWKGHVGSDCDYEMGCRPEGELNDWMAKCPIEIFKRQLIEDDILSEEQFQSVVDKIDADLMRALEWAKKSPYPDKKTVLSNVYFGME